jgi:E-phenylitaconyl-CoA hydratase
VWVVPEIHIEKRGRVALFTLQGDTELNLGVVNADLHRMLLEFRDDDELWCAVLTGHGDKAFSAGADLKRGGGPGFGSTIWDTRPIDLLSGAEFWKPLIAAVHGYCLGAGMMLALGCDIRICTESASFGLPELRYGFPPGMGSLFRLPRVMPLGPAMELLLTGDRITAEQAYRWGLVNRMVPAGQLVSEAMALAERITANPPLAVRASKELAIRGLDMRLDEHMRLQQVLSAMCRQTEDAKEGLAAFKEKRKPEFKGR